MLLGEPPATAYDLHFKLFDVPVRVTPFFWLVAVLLGWDLCVAFDVILEVTGNSPGKGILVLLWVAAVFLSILIHEFGHSLAFRYYGLRSRIALYHFGGLAIPEAGYAGFNRAMDPKSQIVISAAGPGLQLLFAFIIIAGLKISGFAVPHFGLFYDYIPLLSEGRPMPLSTSYAVVDFLIRPSIYWALLNLLPIYPLDGGQISRELFTLSDASQGIKNSLILSIVTGGGIAVYALTQRDTFLAIMFGMLAFSSYTTLQAYTGRGGGFGGPRGW